MYLQYDFSDEIKKGIIYVLGAPLIPFARLWYTFRNASQPGYLLTCLGS